MSFVDLFSDKASLYASARPRYPDELFAFIGALAHAHHCAWDCGTGNGQASASLSRYFSSVQATDPSQEQIANAIALDNVHYSVQRAEQTDFPAGSFDAICVAQALHWFDFDAFFAEVQRVAKPGAVFAAWGYDWFSVSAEFDAAFKASILDIIAPYWAPQNQLLWRGYVDAPIPWPRITAPAFQIQAQWNLYELLAYVHSWSATRRCMTALGAGFFEAAQEALAPLWGTPQLKRNISMPLHLVAARIP